MSRSLTIRVAVVPLLLACPSQAVAQTISADQTLNGSFSAGNVMNLAAPAAPKSDAPDTNGGFLNVVLADDAERPIEPLTQEAVNIGNQMSFEGVDFAVVRQHATVDQSASNAATLFEVTDLKQTGLNTVNLVEANSIQHLDQVLEGTAQDIRNTASVNELAGQLTQSGTNTANLAVARNTIVATFQNFDEASDQTIRNTLNVNGGSGEITQEGLNIGNFIDAHNVDEITRKFSGTQLVENVLYIDAALNEGRILQSGTNIANYVRATGEIETINQTSTGQQIVRNDILGNRNGAHVSQRATSVVNLVESNGLGGGAAVSQTNTTSQVQSGGNSGASQTGNIHRSEN